MVSCFGAYKCITECDLCPLVHPCIEATIENDGYYDQLALEEELAWMEREDISWDQVERRYCDNHR